MFSYLGSEGNYIGGGILKYTTAFFRGEKMEDNRSVTKIFFGAGLIVAFVLLLTSFKVYAFDFDDLEFNYIYRIYGTSDILHSSYGYDINGSHADFWGIECGFPVPTYAGNGDYSLYFKLKFSTDIPDAGFDLICAPFNDSSVYPHTSMTNYIRQNVFGELWTYNCNMKSYYGSFQWHGKSRCDYQYVACRELESAYTGQVEYTLYGVLNMRLMMEDEFEPFRLGLIMNTNDYTSSTMFNVSASLKAMDTSSTTVMVEWFETISDQLDVLDTIDGSLYSTASTLLRIEDVLDSLSFGDNVTIQKLTAILNSINGQNESLFSDDDTDEDLTEWDEHNSVVASAASDLHDLEESLVGTLSDYEFPTVANQTAVNNVLLPFWNNELVIALTLAMMSLMIVFLIL